MMAMAFQRVAVLLASGASDPKSYIAAGDRCTIGARALSGLWPVTYPTIKGSKTRYVRSLKGFLCNQNSYSAVKYPAAGYDSATVKTSGCGICALINALGALRGTAPDVRTMASFAMAWGARVPGGTNMKTLLTHAATRWSFRYTTTSSREELLLHLQKGGVAICNVAGRGMFSSGGHYMAVLGELDGKLCIADSGLYAGKYGTAKRKAAVTVSGDLIFASVSDLDTDCVGRTPRYYLLSKV